VQRDDPEAVDQEELYGTQAETKNPARPPPEHGVGAGEVPQYAPGRGERRSVGLLWLGCLVTTALCAAFGVRRAGGPRLSLVLL
jgi:hypothetical protein